MAMAGERRAEPRVAAAEEGEKTLWSSTLSYARMGRRRRRKEE